GWGRWRWRTDSRGRRRRGRRLRQHVAKLQRNRGCRDQRDHGMTKKAAAIHSGGLHGLMSKCVAQRLPGFRWQRMQANTQGWLSSHARYVMGLLCPAKLADTD